MYLDPSFLPSILYAGDTVFKFVYVCIYIYQIFKVFLGLFLFLLALYSFLPSTVSCEERKSACTYNILGCSVFYLKFVYFIT